MPARNLQVYAKWAKPDYTVSFNTHGADTETPAPIGVAKYDTIEDQMPADPTREGYVFAGWYTDEAYTVPFVATQQIVRNLTLHAKWTRTDSCTYVIVAKDTEGNELKRVDGSEVEVDVYKRQTLGLAEKQAGDDYISLFDRADQMLLARKKARRARRADSADAGGERSICTDMALIRRELREKDPPKGAFCQDYETFKQIYRFVERGLKRSGQSAYIILMTLRCV